MSPESSEDRGIWTVHVVTPIGKGIGLGKTQLWGLDEAFTKINMVSENMADFIYVYELGSKETNLCGTVGSPAWEHDSNMVLAVTQMFGEQFACTNI